MSGEKAHVIQLFDILAEASATAESMCHDQADHDDIAKVLSTARRAVEKKQIEWLMRDEEGGR